VRILLLMFYDISTFYIVIHLQFIENSLKITKKIFIRSIRRNKRVLKPLDIKCDIIIVGGGPAGLSSAIEASHPGIEVILIEKEKEIGYPIHTSGATWIKEIEKFGIDDRFYNPIYKVRFISPNKEAFISMDKPRSCILNVRLLYQYLAERAAERGTRILMNTRAIQPIIEDKNVVGVIAQRNGMKLNIFGKVVIDASGFSSVIARKVGLSKGFKRYGSGAEYSLFAPNWPQDEVLFVLGNEVAPNGYGWVFPEGGKRVKVGIGLIKPISKGDPKKYLDLIMNDISLISDSLTPHSEIEYHRGFIPSEDLLPSTVFNGLIVVGDAAGQILAFAGEGIRFALDIGRIAGKVAQEAVLKGSLSKNFFIKYEREWRRKYEKIFKIGYKINKRISKYTDEKWDESINYLNKIPADLSMKALKADFSFGFFLGLLMSNPKIFGEGIFRMVKKYLKKVG